MDSRKRVGDDLYLYKKNEVFIIEDYYKRRNKNNRENFYQNKICPQYHLTYHHKYSSKPLLFLSFFILLISPSISRKFPLKINPFYSLITQKINKGNRFL